MIKITIIALGSLKEKYLKEAAAEYTKRLKGYCDLNIIELGPVRLPDKPSQSEIDSSLEREADAILKKIPEESAVYPLCIEGIEQTSEQLANLMAENSNMGKSITFIIGSSYGLSEKVKQKAQKRLSFSRLTFPHQLFRVMLLEQIYRAFRINSGTAYHK